MPQALPLQPSVPSYRVGTELGPDRYLLDVRWNGRDEAWYLDVLDADGAVVRRGLKVALGALIGRGALPGGGRLLASDLSGEAREATLDDLGARVLVYFFPDEELA